MPRLTMQEQLASFTSSLRSIEKLYEQYAKSVGLSYIGLCVLEAIYTTKNCTQKLICEHTSLPKQTVNVIIRFLWEQGYVEMKEIDTDRRNKEIWLTESGREYAANIAGTLKKIEESVLAQFTYEQRQDVIELMKRLENGLRESMQAAL